jgi:hypothetical protein
VTKEIAIGPCIELVGRNIGMIGMRFPPRSSDVKLLR